VGGQGRRAVFITSPQMLPEKLRGAAPGQLGGMTLDPQG
jgi:hypothetical protein